MLTPPRYAHRTGCSVSGRTTEWTASGQHRVGDLAQPRTGRTIIVITLSNQQGYVSDTCGQAERKAVRGQACRSPVRFRWADPALNRQCHQPPAGRHPGAPGRTGSARRSARLALRQRRADVRHGAEQALPHDELAATRTGAAACAVSSGLRRAGRLRAPAPIWSTSAGADPGDCGQDQPRLTACFSGKSQPWIGRSSIPAHWRQGKWERTEGKSILPAQRPRSSAHGLESAGAADAGEARFERVCGI